MQATVVAFYGAKQESLRALLYDSQCAVAEILGSRFRKYRIEQIHGTIVGLERYKKYPNRFLNRNFKIFRNREVAMDFGGLLHFLRESRRFPFQLQIGGFEDRDYPFSSRAARPFDRCFSLQGKSVVVMGWPLRRQPMTRAQISATELIPDATCYPETLNSIRRDAQRYGILHAYHAKIGDIDNDFFFRIGMIDDPSSVDSVCKKMVHKKMRNFLAVRDPLILNVDLPDLNVVFYESEELPSSSSSVLSLTNENSDDGVIRKKFDSESL